MKKRQFSLSNTEEVVARLGQARRLAFLAVVNTAFGKHAGVMNKLKK